MRTSFTRFCEEALAPQGFAPAAHHRLLTSHLEAIERGDIDRLLIAMPPGSAKSTYTSHLFPAWFMAKHPNCRVIGASHKSDLAEDVSRAVKNYITDFSADLEMGLATDALNKWIATNGSEYRAFGAGAGISGFRSDLFLVDDPFGDRKQADSSGQREDIWNWFAADVCPRMRPNNKVVVIATRWHEDDLSGRLLERQPGKWTVLKLPAQATSEDDPLGRKPGEWLWADDPSYDYASVAKRQLEDFGEGRDWWSLYQQEPRPAAGSLFKTGNIAATGDVPEGKTVRAWDLAATAQVGTKNPDWTVGLKMVRTSSGRFMITDVVRFRGGPDEVEARIRHAAEADGKTVEISLPQDPGQAGKVQVLHLTRMLSGFNVHSSPESGDKATRAAPVAAQVNVGNVGMLKAEWNHAFLDELGGFPSSAKKDQVDALSRAFERLATPSYDSSMKWVDGVAAVVQGFEEAA